MHQHGDFVRIDVGALVSGPAELLELVRLEGRHLSELLGAHREQEGVILGTPYEPLEGDHDRVLLAVG